MFELRYSKRHVHNRFMRYRWAMTKQSSFFGCLKVLTNFVFFQFHHYQNSHYQLPFGRNNNFLSMHSHVDKLFFVLVVSFAASLFWFLKWVHWKIFMKFTANKAAVSVRYDNVRWILLGVLHSWWTNLTFCSVDLLDVLDR